MHVINIWWSCLKGEIWDVVLFKDDLSPQHSFGGRALFIPMKAAQWCFEAMKIPRSLTRFSPWIKHNKLKII